jgi:2-polyprenyl-3-methyl-5-hydroxy-6-metoxy-1,4-benzoquinol methylase
MTTGYSAFAARKGVEDAARRMARRLEAERIPAPLRSRWRAAPASANQEWLDRLRRFRTAVVPWFDSDARLVGSKILEVGVGHGSSTAALAEQGAHVTGIDINADDLADAARHLADMGLTAKLEICNAAELARFAEGAGFERIVFWAVLEHMTIDERIMALKSAWSCLPPGGLLTVVETPNRLWPLDSHTSFLPFFSWLPYELGYRYSRNSPRPTFGDRYLDEQQAEMLHFLRRGHGVSFHEFDLAIGDHRSLDVASCMQRYWRDRNPARRVGWALSLAGRTERVLAEYSSQTDRAWFQPFLYFTLRKH